MSEPESLCVQLDRMVKEAGLRYCFCSICKHQGEYGPCESCWCKNKAAAARRAEGERDAE